jgi:hypothetical protein
LAEFDAEAGDLDADGIQRGEVASRVRSSGTSSEDLAEQLGFSSPQDMAGGQNTDFIEDKYQEELARRAIEEALDERYGAVPADIQALRDFEDSKGRPGRYGFLDDGRKVTVRDTSSDGRPTLEIDPPQGEQGGIKIRYDD